MTLEAIRYERGSLQILDQLLLPAVSKYIPINNTRDGWAAIHSMQVRGAPAIAIVGCLSLAVELIDRPFLNRTSLQDYVADRLTYLVTARPTAVNLTQAAQELKRFSLILASTEGVDVPAMKTSIVEAIEAMLEKDVADNTAIGENGANHILENTGEQPINVLTHCNTGSLATAGYGTALGVIRSLHAKNRLERVYCTETRPYNQGARLTAYELVHDNIPATLVCDSMVAALMNSRKITAVVVGADRVVSNGDTANKIGTYQLSIVAKHHNVPFYVAAPCTSIDMTLATGEMIPIEERSQAEVTEIAGQRIAAPGIQCWNPAFDVTPAALITGGIITERGVFPSHMLKDCLKKFNNGA